jgi:hypothetical protein
MTSLLNNNLIIYNGGAEKRISGEWYASKGEENHIL